MTTPESAQPPATPIADDVARAIGALAAQWKQGTIGAVVFTDAAQEQINRLGQLERDLAQARAELNQVRENLYSGLDRDRDNITTPHLATVASNAIAALRASLAKAEEEVRAVVELIPGAVRVCEGGGPEDVFASLAVSVAKMVADFKQTNTNPENK